MHCHLIGREPLSLTLCIAAAGAIGSAAACGARQRVTGLPSPLDWSLGTAGRLYPLSATKAAESDDDDANAIGRTAWAFFIRPGMCAPYVVAIILRACLAWIALSLTAAAFTGIGRCAGFISYVFMEDAQRSGGTQQKQLEPRRRKFKATPKPDLLEALRGLRRGLVCATGPVHNFIGSLYRRHGAGK